MRIPCLPTPSPFPYPAGYPVPVRHQGHGNTLPSRTTYSTTGDPRAFHLLSPHPSADHVSPLSSCPQMGDSLPKAEACSPPGKQAARSNGPQIMSLHFSKVAVTDLLHSPSLHSPLCVHLPVTLESSGEAGARRAVEALEQAVGSPSRPQGWGEPGGPWSLGPGG